MKNSILILTIIFMTGCKAWDPSMISVQKDPISPKLLSLERRMEDLANTTVNTNDDELKVFTEEVEKNLINPYGDKYGYIAYKKNVLDYSPGMGMLLLSSFTLTVPNLFGMPYQTIKYKVEVELRIMDSQNRLIGKYSAIGEAKSTVAYYYGYSIKSAVKRTYPEAIKDAFSKIRPQIQADVKRLNKALKEAGKL
ncbi:hypothetical protein [Salibacter halophilus]|uniref:Uncharacterized protein n=1 Tax=Salibacter halophilus TaxID=1803916 RepID=A0A6N6MED0_9FLAO|nr:hypothetical protein [Salibacter halophilus]KAB1066065.1 hypothetical protein F3059_00935 [Salibacter halophilus]